jgi:hypothetical protein
MHVGRQTCSAHEYDYSFGLHGSCPSNLNCVNDAMMKCISNCGSKGAQAFCFLHFFVIDYHPAVLQTSVPGTWDWAQSETPKPLSHLPVVTGKGKMST